MVRWLLVDGRFTPSVKLISIVIVYVPAQHLALLLHHAQARQGKKSSHKCGLTCGIICMHGRRRTNHPTCNTQTPIQAKEYKSVDGGEGGIQLPAHEMLTTPAS